ncbi:MAG: hypothetical protein ACR2K5_05770 [Pseudolabrys sp.]
MGLRACLWSGAVSGILLGGCAGDPITAPTLNTARAGNWEIERQIDRITGIPISSSSLAAKSSHQREPFPKNALLQLACFKDAQIVRFAFEVTIGATRNVDFGYRFDEKPGRQAVKIRITQDYRTAVIEDPDEVRDFIAGLQTSQTLYVLIRSLNAGRTAVEFKLDGAPAAVAAAYAGCPIKPPEAAKAKSRPKPKRQ